jgi:cell division protein FtsZ
MAGAGSALMGIGSAPRRVTRYSRCRTCDRLTTSRSLYRWRPRRLDVEIAGGSDLGLFELSEAAEMVAKAAHPDAEIIFGTAVDDALGDEVRITVIAAGFDGGEPKKVEMRSH